MVGHKGAVPALRQVLTTNPCGIVNKRPPSRSEDPGRTWVTGLSKHAVFAHWSVGYDPSATGKC